MCLVLRLLNQPPQPNSSRLVCPAPAIPLQNHVAWVHCSARSATVFQTAAGSHDTMSAPWNQVVLDCGNAGPVAVVDEDQTAASIIKGIPGGAKGEKRKLKMSRGGRGKLVVHRQQSVDVFGR